MADEQGLFIFPGLPRISRGSFTLSAGTKPSVALLEVPATIGLVPTIGTLQIRFGGTVLSFPNAKPSEAIQRRGREGWIWSVSILDRRWKWEFGPISGHYNERTNQGRFIKESTKKTPRELATLCFDAMGETNYDLSLLPNENYPEINWDAIHASSALQDLLEKTGCRIVLGTNNVAKIYPIGHGAKLPTTAVMNDSFTFDPPEKPDTLRFVGAAIKYQAKFLLEAVGRDNDGKIKLLDDLAYKPGGASGRWSMPELFVDVTDEDDRKLAKATVFRWYRVKGLQNGGSTLSVPGLVTFSTMNQVVLLDELVEQVEDPQTGEQKARQPFVIGAHSNGEFFRADTDVAKRTQTSFRVIPNTNMIEFSDPVFLGVASGGVAGATGLSLETAFHARNSTTNVLQRFELERSIGGALDTKARIVKHDEVLLTKRAVYSGTSVTEIFINDVTDRVSDYANLYLDGVAAEYQTVASEDRSFAGILNLSPDGAISQVSWSVGRDGATTRASRGAEHSVIVPDYEQRQRGQQLKSLVEKYPVTGPIMQMFHRRTPLISGLPIK